MDTLPDIVCALQESLSVEIGLVMAMGAVTAFIVAALLLFRIV